MSSSSSSVVVPASNDDFSIGDESEGKLEMRKIRLRALMYYKKWAWKLYLLMRIRKVQTPHIEFI